MAEYYRANKDWLISLTRSNSYLIRSLALAITEVAEDGALVDERLGGTTSGADEDGCRWLEILSLNGSNIISKSLALSLLKRKMATDGHSTIGEGKSPEPEINVV